MARLRTHALVLLSTTAIGCYGAADLAVSPVIFSEVHDPDFIPRPFAIQRLSGEEIRQTVADAFGATVMSPQPLPATEGYALFQSIDSATVSTTPEAAEQYDAFALDVAARVFVDRTRQPELARCAAASSGDVCVVEALRTWAMKVWHRPLSAEEELRYLAVVGAGGGGTTAVAQGMKFALAGMVQSPHFLYRAAVGEAAAGGYRRLSNLELARHLAYTLWGRGPDLELMNDALAGRLVTDSVLKAQAQRMLASPKADHLAARWLSEAWGVSKLAPQSKNILNYPNWTPELVADAREEFIRRVDEIAAGGDLRETLRGRSTFVNARLSSIYGLPAPVAGWERASLPSHRSGLLTSVAALSALSHSETSTPIFRGVFVLEKLMCRKLPGPPASAGTITDQLEAANGPRTNRVRMEERLANTVCASCHEALDPTGFVFEAFNSMGAQRPSPVDTVGSFEGRPFTEVTALADSLATNRAVADCWAQQLYSFALGRYAEPNDDETTARISTQFQGADFRFDELATAVVMSRGFRELTPTP
jgi:hypothetical protein